MDLIVKKCDKCGALIQAIRDCDCDNCGIKCCNTNMRVLEVNSVDASREKHIPNYKFNDDMVDIYVEHVMDSDHYIEWISIVYDNNIYTKYFNPGDEVSLSYEYVKGMKIYAYCNKHDLWMREVK